MFKNLLKFDGDEPETETKKKVERKPVKGSKKNAERGCSFCPLNNVKVGEVRINKVKNLDKLQGKDIMIWGLNPGQEENASGKELVGPSGKLLWREGKPFGLKRENCDIQNVVRCATLRESSGEWLENRPIEKVELHCCSIYTEEALKIIEGKPKVHLILGAVAAKQVLRGEYRKDKSTFFSKKLQAWVVCIYHPAYFLRGGPKSKLKEFRNGLKNAVEKAEGMGRFQYIQNQDYKEVKAKNIDAELKEPMLASEQIIAVDIEDGRDEEGKNKIVCVGFSWKKGQARILFLDHPEAKQSEEQRDKKLQFLRWMLENKDIKKSFHHGVYDVWKLQHLLDIGVKGFIHDTMYSEYLRFSHYRAYGLAALADRRFREFAGYKEILDEYKTDKKEEFVNIWNVPKSVIIPYNGADCDLTGRLTRENHKKVNHALLRVFVRAAFVIARMQELGPFFDKEHDQLLEKWIPVKVAMLKKQIQDMAGDDKFNPNAPLQVAKIIYDKLHLDKHLDDRWKRDFFRSTNKETMELLMGFHEFPKLIQEYRVLAKKDSTYMKGYRKSAELHEGRLRTNWWITGTVTGRLRSSGDREHKWKGEVNLQNIHGDADIENLLVSDLRWREMYQDWRATQKN